MPPSSSSWDTTKMLTSGRIFFNISKPLIIWHCEWVLLAKYFPFQLFNAESLSRGRKNAEIVTLWGEFLALLLQQFLGAWHVL